MLFIWQLFSKGYCKLGDVKQHQMARKVKKCDILALCNKILNKHLLSGR